MSLTYQQSLNDGETWKHLLEPYWKPLAIRYISPGEYTIIVRDCRYATMTMYRLVECSLNEQDYQAEAPRPWWPSSSMVSWIPIH